MLKENWLRTIEIDGVAETSDSQTKKIKLPTSNFIGAIWLRCQATVNNAGNDADFAHLFLDQIDKIRIVGNGSTNLVDLTPKELRNVMAPILGTIPVQNFTTVEGEYSWADLPIVFGRYLYDEDYILPAQLFKNLTLEIQYSMETSDPAWDTGTFIIFCDIEEFISNKDPLSVNLIKRSQVESGTTKSGNIDVDMPLGGIYKRIMIQVEDEDAAENTDVTQVQFRINNGAEIPITAGWDQLQLSNGLEFNMPQAELCGSTCKANDDTILTDLGTVVDYKVALKDPNPTANVVSICGVDAISGGELTMDMYKSAALTEATDASRTISADTTCQTIMWWAKALAAIPETAWIVFDKLGDMLKCPDSNLWNDAKVRLTGANANGSYSVVLEEVLKMAV